MYDIFGLLGAGGSLVLLNDAGRRNADLWFDLVGRYHVTLWNSVPILFEMLMVYRKPSVCIAPVAVGYAFGRLNWHGCSGPIGTRYAGGT